MEPKGREFAAVVFDLDGTLIDSGAVVFESFKYALEPFGIVCDDVLLEGIRALPALEVFKDLLPPKDAKVAFERLASFATQGASKIPLFPGIKDMLATLKTAGIRMSVWTGRPAFGAEQVLRLNGVRDYFETVVGGCMVAVNKPDPSGLHLTLEKMALMPSQILVVGDHPHDWEGARAAECAFAGAAWAKKPAHLPEHHFMIEQPTPLFKRVEEFAEWLG
ncbi:HAD-IA family hydrolase [Bdellovibrionota bacterium FG-2]